MEPVTDQHSGAAEIHFERNEIVDTERIAPPSAMCESLVIAEVDLVV